MTDIIVHLILHKDKWQKPLQSSKTTNCISDVLEQFRLSAYIPEIPYDQGKQLRNV